MEQTSLTRRVEILEQHVELLKDLPARMTAVEAQILQLRRDMESGFSALSYAINAMHADVVARFEAQDKRFDEHDRRFDEHDRRFDEHDRRFDEHDKRFDEHDKRFDAQDRRFDALERRFDALETRLDDFRHQMHVLHDDVLERIARLGER